MSRGHGASTLVAALSASFGVGLLQVTGVIAQAIRGGGGRAQDSATVAVLLDVLAMVFIVVAVYAGAVVIANTFATVVAGRVREIALRRLLGATASSERRAIAKEGLLVGLAGAAVGLGVGTGFAVLTVLVAVQRGVLPDLAYSFLSPTVLIPMCAVVLTTWLAGAVGSRRVLAVTPVQALGAAEEADEQEARASRVRSVSAVVLAIAGTGLLVLGVLLGLVTPYALLVAMAGGVVSFTGIVLGAHLVIPRALRATGRLFGSTPTARLARENAVRFPMRSTGSTVGLLVAVTLITTFGVAITSFGDLLRQGAAEDPEYYAGIDRLVTGTTTVFSALIGFSAVIAAVGLVNALSLGVVQRTRELGLLRALGFTAAQLRRMVAAESGQLVLTAVTLGLVLGAAYGWAGAQSLLGSVHGVGVVLPGIPWGLVGVVAAGAAVLTVVASLAPARRATRVTPVEALGVE